MAQSKQVVTVGGHSLTLTNLDKVIYPETGTTKADVLEYYAAVAEVLIPHAAQRPATRKRWVHGVGTAEHPGEVFFQKNLDVSTPSWVTRASIEHKDHTNEYPLVNNLATLTWLAQTAALEIHVPQWRFDRAGKPRNPDRFVLDLDPGEGVGLAECAEVARSTRAILNGMGLDPLPVTSGSKGIHLYAALDGRETSDRVSAFAHELARSLEADHPDLVVSDMKRALRAGKVLVDWSQNNAAKTTITPYSLRGRAHPFVAVPRTWRELAAKDLAHLDYRQVMQRVKRRADPLAALEAGSGGSVTEAGGKKGAGGKDAGGRGAAGDRGHGGDGGEGEAGDEPPRDRLHLYRSKRDATKTPEPVPATHPAASTAQTFIIQEHHARKLHYDFRLEREGVLVSWAVPKGMPTSPDTNHLAVQTEDHPLEYARFEGIIPRGEYGAGTVSTWDAGVYDLEKWRDGAEIIVTLHGTKPGGLGEPTRVALLHTGGEGRAASNWLLHLMKDPVGHEKAAKRPRAPARSTLRLAPMLATLGEASDIADPQEWSFEMKWDGIRAIAQLGPEADDVHLFTRNGNEVTASYPEIAEELRAAAGAGEVVLDGEIVALDARSRPDFGRLQARMGLTLPAEVAEARRAVPVHYLVFDVLQTAAKSLTAEPYAERRQRLADLVTPTPVIQVPPAIEGDLDLAVRSSRELDLEGVMAKRLDSRYRVGRRSADWVKLKHHRAQEVVVGGWRPGKGRRAGGVGSLLLGIPSEGGLRYVGRVGTGFSDRDLEAIRRTLRGLERATSPFLDMPREDAADAHWVGGGLVAEVEFAEWTAEGRLRQPTWRGWRPDKSPKDIVAE